MTKLNALFGQGLVMTLCVIVAIGSTLSLATLLFIDSSAPSTLVITSGPPNSVFQKTAEKYQALLAREGVTVKIVPSSGSIDNLKNLTATGSNVDIGFVLGGETTGKDIHNLMSLGSISYQPLMVFYRGKHRPLLSDFKGQRLDIGEPGSGTHTLALNLLKLNGIEPGDGTTLVNSIHGDPVRDLLDNRLDAIFVMGDSTSTDLMRTLLHTPDIHLYSFTQADAYARKISYLNKLVLPEGVLDFGKDIPSENTNLIGPSVELVARKGLNPALSDLLLDAAREVHGTPGIFKQRNEFPAPMVQDIPISPDATRYYASGKSFLYRTFPFWLAGLIARTLALIVPFALFLIPALKMAPAIYRWRIQSGIYRWYRALLDIESEAIKHPGDMQKRKELLRHLDHIETTVSKIVVPAAFGDLLYGLRGHIDFVRERLAALPDSDNKNGGLGPNAVHLSQ